MKPFVILTDTTSDMEKSLREQYNIEYVPMNYLVGEDEFVASLDWESHSPKEFYDIMRGGTRITTTQVPQTVFAETFDKYLSEGYDVLYIACSSGLSASVNTGNIVAKEAMAAHEGSTIICVDTLISSLGQAHLVIEAAKKRDEGMSIEDTAAYIESIKMNMNQFATVGSLEYLRRAGRVTASSAFFGNLLGIKPIIISDRLGKNYAMKKVKGTANARNEIAKLVVDAADGNYDSLYVVHANCLEDAQALRDAILALAPFKNVHMDVIRPIVGASVGPGTVGAYCFGKEVMIEGKE